MSSQKWSPATLHQQNSEGYTDRPTNGLTTRLASTTTDRSASRPTNESTDQPTDQLADRLTVLSYKSASGGLSPCSIIFQKNDFNPYVTSHSRWMTDMRQVRGSWIPILERNYVTVARGMAEEFILRTSHLRYDLIRSSNWNAKGCLDDDGSET